MFKKIISVFLLAFSLNSFAASPELSLVPVSKPKEVSVDVPIIFDYSLFETWSSINQFLRKGEFDTITFRVSGYGGTVDIGNSFIRAIEDARANGKKINMDVIGPAYSMHAVIVCFADKVALRDGASLMFHSGAIYRTYLFGLITFRDINQGPNGEALFRYMINNCVKNKVLDAKDVAIIESGQDIIIENNGGIIHKYSTRDEVSLLSTLADISILAGTVGALLLVLMLVVLIIKRVK